MNHAIDEGAALSYIISLLIKQSNSVTLKKDYTFIINNKALVNKEALDQIVINQIKN